MKLCRVRTLGCGFPLAEDSEGAICEFVADADGALVIRFRRAVLTCADVQAVVSRVHRSGRPSYGRIHFDFSGVAELVGPWGVHFAVLARLAQTVPGRVQVSGLHGQPAALAWLFRRSPEVRALLENGPTTPQAGPVRPDPRRRVA